MSLGLMGFPKFNFLGLEVGRVLGSRLFSPAQGRLFTPHSPVLPTDQQTKGTPSALLRVLLTFSILGH